MARRLVRRRQAERDLGEQVEYAPRLAGLRVWPVPGFRRFLIFYRVTTNTVVRVLHSARDVRRALDEK